MKRVKEKYTTGTEEGKVKLTDFEFAILELLENISDKLGHGQ